MRVRDLRSADVRRGEGCNRGLLFFRSCGRVSEVARTLEHLPTFVETFDGNETAACSAVPIELHIVLAPNLENAWEKGQLTVGFEVLARGNRYLATALDAKQTFACSHADLEVLTRARSFAGNQMPGMTILDRDQFLTLAAVLTNHPRVTSARRFPVTISSDNVLPVLRVKFGDPDSTWFYIDQVMSRPLARGHPCSWCAVE